MKVFLDALARIPTISIGTQAYIIADMQLIEKKNPGCEFILLSSFPKMDDYFLKITGLNYTLIQRASSKWGEMRQFRQIVSNVDAVISAWGDAYITFPPYKILQKAIFLKKNKVPLLLFTSSIGPFNKGLKTKMAKCGLQMFDYISVRDIITYESIVGIGIKDVNLVHDTAFVLEPSSDKVIDQIIDNCGLKKESKFIGINISILLYHNFNKYGKDYIKEMSGYISWIRDTYKLSILLIPHQIYPSIYSSSPEEISSIDGDDRYAIDLIWQNILNHENLFRLTGEYSPMDLKGVIKRAEVFIGGRMHAIIGAISQSVPSLIMKYSHKASGMMKLFNMEDLVWDISETPSAFKTKFQYLWESRNKVRESLTIEMKKNLPAIYGLTNEIERRLK